MVTITREYDKDSIADGTVEGEKDTFSPDAGLKWSIKYVKPDVDTTDEDNYMELGIGGEVLLTLNTAHLPSNPDLIPVKLVVTSKDEIWVRSTNQSGATKDNWLQMFIEETSA